MSLSQQAESFKAEGNALYIEGNHKAAITKYTAAIKIAPDNALLLANRAACYLALKQYEQARQDAQKATELDPKYAKGWGRLGAAFEGLSKYKDAVKAYGQAIECIDAASSLSEDEKRLKALYKFSYTNMNLRAEGQTIIRRSEAEDTKMPWELAKEREMANDLPAESSGQIVLAAWQCFERAKLVIGALVVLPNGLMGGQTGGLEDLSNAILTDERCIFFRLGDTLLQDYNRYLLFQAAESNAQWINMKDPQRIIRLANNRLHQTQDWDSIRGALSCQARNWIVLCFMGKLTGQPRDELFLWYDRTCKLIELGRAEWPDVPREDRGTIFDETFLRGVQVLRMNAYMQAYDVKHLRASGKFTLDGLIALADEILTQLENTPPEKVEYIRTIPYFYFAFYLYPKAAAWGIRGYVYYRKATFRHEGTILEHPELMKKSGEAYLKSADLYPEDDENRCLMLKYAIMNYSAAKITAREMLPIMERLRLAYPKMRSIWRNSVSALQGVHKQFVQIIVAEDEFRQGLATGKVTLDDRIKLPIL